jgi:hypothetical protein
MDSVVGALVVDATKAAVAVGTFDTQCCDSDSLGKSRKRHLAIETNRDTISNSQ